MLDYIVYSFNESVSDAMESFRSECYGIICKAINKGIEIGKTRYQPNNAQISWKDVNGSLPEEGKRVGVLTKEGSMYFGCVFNGSFPKNVTHYFEIPEPPKK